VCLQERLVTVVLGALRQHKYEFIDVYKDEASTTLKAVVKQVTWFVDIRCHGSVCSRCLLLTLSSPVVSNGYT